MWVELRLPMPDHLFNEPDCFREPFIDLPVRVTHYGFGGVVLLF